MSFNDATLDHEYSEKNMLADSRVRRMKYEPLNKDISSKLITMTSFFWARRS